MPRGLKIVHWNLHSIAPRQGNKHFSTVIHQYLPTTNQTPNRETLHNFVSSEIPDDVLTIPHLTCDEDF